MCVGLLAKGKDTEKALNERHFAWLKRGRIAGWRASRLRPDDWTLAFLALAYGRFPGRYWAMLLNNVLILLSRR